MNRRDFTVSFLGTLAAAAAGSIYPEHAEAASPEPDSGKKAASPDGKKRHIAVLLFEGMTSLDFLAPATVLAASGQFNVDYVWRDKNPVYEESRSEKRLGFMPTATFEEIRSTDILCVPGTSNPYAPIREKNMVDWVANVGAGAEWVTSVCTGSFILGAAGLLKGYKATSHWTMVEELRYFGATPVFDRVVQDRNRVTGAGVTSGIDFGLVLLSVLCGEQRAKMVQLMLEYKPAPPFPGGSPKTTEPNILEAARKNVEAQKQKNIPYARQTLLDAAKRLGIPVTE